MSEIGWIAHRGISCVYHIMSHWVRGVRKSCPPIILSIIHVLISRIYPAVIFGRRMLGIATYNHSINPILVSFPVAHLASLCSSWPAAPAMPREAGKAHKPVFCTVDLGNELVPSFVFLIRMLLCAFLQQWGLPVTQSTS